MKPFIDENIIQSMLDDAKTSSKSMAEGVIQKALKLEGLSLNDAAILLHNDDEDILELLFSAASKIKDSIYKNRLVLFAPLYITNRCQNSCRYCAFQKDNESLQRVSLSTEEILNQVSILLSQGHKRVLLVAGDDPVRANIEQLEGIIDAIYRFERSGSRINRININLPPMSVDNFKRLKEAGIGTYQLFQETYHRETYNKMHPSGPKSDYKGRLFAMDEAISGGIDDVGLGVLFGLYDYKFDVLALLTHANYLERKFGFGPHTVSIPRIKPALGAQETINPPHAVSDTDFLKLTAIIRLAIPYTGIILSTRESAELRNRMFGLGISQISAGSRTGPGEYSGVSKANSEQFSLYDQRTLLDVVKEVTGRGYMPSFCTACYRSERTGERFMKLAKTASIHNYCTPNAILTFKEFIVDYGDNALIESGKRLINRELEKVTLPDMKSKILKGLSAIEKGKRDVYF
ncbi:MAG: [FeFe] hydrogenase H-cluster radical SAM maturase HydG [Pseudomonadota bacterium]